MKESSFQDLLEKRNDEFIDLFSSESAIWLMDSLRGGKYSKVNKKCVLLSFDPPLASPPMVFNWNEDDVWFMRNLKHEEEDFNKVEEYLAKSELPYVVFLEKKTPDYKNKVNAFINHFQTRYKNKSLTDLPKFFLAEYRSPLSRVKISLLEAGIP